MTHVQIVRIALATGLAIMATTFVVGGFIGTDRVTGSPTTPGTEAATTTLRFATYNVCAANCPGLRPFTSRAPKLVNQISASGADIIGVEELGGSRTRAIFAKAIAAKGYTYAAGAGGRSLFYKQSAVAITDASGSRMAGTGFFMRANSNSALRGGAYQVFRSRTTDQLFLVCDLHLSSLDSAIKDSWRLDEAKKATALLASVKERYPSVHTILIGDFNSLTHQNTSASSDSDRWRVNELLTSRGFRDSMHATANRINYKLASINQMPSDHRRFPTSFQLDHFYVESGVTVNRWALANRNVSYKNQYSDHDMIYMTATFPANWPMGSAEGLGLKNG